MNNFLANVGAITFIVIIITFLCFVCGNIGHVIMYHNQPPAIEVYRGNATLEITYKDGIPIDSVVVYKKNK